MPKTLTLLSGFLVASLIVTGLINARGSLENAKLNQLLSDAQVVITAFNDIESICEPNIVRFQLNNTSTVGGGPVPMVGALLEARFPKRHFFDVREEDIDLDRGNVTIGEDGDDYVITNNIGDVAPNDIHNMNIRLTNFNFLRYADFAGEVRSNTFDPNPANNSNTIFPEYNFGPPTKMKMSGFGNVSEDPPVFEPTIKLPRLRVPNPSLPFQYEISLLFDDEECSNLPADRRFEFQNGSWTTSFKDIANAIENIEVVDPSHPVEVTTEGNDIKATFELGTFSYGDELKFGLNVKLNSEYSGTFEYTTELDAENIEDDVDIFTDSGTITVEEPALPDLKIWKMADLPDSTQIPMLDTLRYTLKVTNIGDANAVDVAIKDTIPNPQFALHAAVSNRGPCEADGPRVTCEVGEVAPGDTVTVDIRVVASFPGPAINRAHVTTTSEEVTIENNISNEVIHFPVTAERRADLHVEIVSSIPDTLRNDGIFSQHIMVINRGPNEAQNATLIINFTAPVLIKYLGYIPYGSISCQKPNSDQFVLAVTCTISSLPVKGYASVRIVGVADVQLFGSFKTEAEVVAGTPQDPDLTNNKDDVDLTVKPGSANWPANPLPQPPVGVPVLNPNQVWVDLELNKSILLPVIDPFAPPFLVGSNIFYRYTVRNNGKDDAKDISFSDLFMGHPNFKNYLHSSLPAALQPNCSITSGPLIQSLDCTLGDLAPGGTITFGITAEAVDSIGIGLMNTAFVMSKTADPNLANNSMSNVVNIYKLPQKPLHATDLQFTYSEQNSPRITIDDTLRTITSTVTNISNVAAMHATYTDTLPEALRFVSMTYNGPEAEHPFCIADRVEFRDAERDRIVCHLPILRAGESVSVDMDVSIKHMGHLNMIGRVRSANYDEDLTNNVDSLKLVNPMGTSLNEPNDEQPSTTELHQNYPNPFNPSTSITFYLSRRDVVSLDVFSVDGRRIKRILNGHVSAGLHRVTFDAGKLSSGVYIYRLSTSTETIHRKMTLLK